MVILYWWLIPIWLAIIVAAILLYIRVSKKKQKKTNARTPIAHSERVTALDTYQRLYQRYRLSLLALIGVIGIGLIVAVIISSRPVSQSLSTPEQTNRDIMLCLDVSSSMAGTNKQVFQTFSSLVEKFDGQRIGLTSFNSSSITVFPLTDDYELIKFYLARGVKGYEAYASSGNRAPSIDTPAYEDYQFIVNGTSSNFKGGSSLAGDGLAGCVNRMGSNGQNRSQSIIFATDNEVTGTETVKLADATTFARSKDIRVYAIDPGSSSSFGSVPKAHEALKTEAVKTGGAYYLADSVQVETIIGEISKQEATLFSAPPELVNNDIPGPFIVISILVIIGLLVFGWRMKL
jgi:Ca-activated chloride channel family protein